MHLGQHSPSLGGKGLGQGVLHGTDSHPPVSIYNSKKYGASYIFFSQMIASQHVYMYVKVIIILLCLSQSLITKMFYNPSPY